jgi:molybdopterin-guanine dinucleotide biosynthesis protein A
VAGSVRPRAVGRAGAVTTVAAVAEEPGRRVDGVAGLLLTGGASRRMGVDKASLVVDGVRLAQRTAGILSAVVTPALEVGPGRSTLPVVEEAPPGQGPLVAAAAGFRALAEGGHAGPVVVVATDLPRLTPAVVHHLARHPSTGSIVPLVAGRAQWLVARWSPRAVGRASVLVGRGERSMQALAEDVLWIDLSDRADELADVDAPADLRAAGLAPVTEAHGDG